MEMDPGVLMSLMNQEENTGFEFIWVLLVFLIFGFGGRGGLGIGASNIADMEAAVKAANCSQTQLGMLFDAIGGNRDALGNLATSLGADIQIVQQAVHSLSSGICDLGYKMGMDSRDIISAITTGNSSLQAELANCCCTTNRNIDSVRYDMALMKGDIVNGMDKGFCSVNNSIKDATYVLSKNQSDLSNQLQSGLCELNNSMTSQLNQLNFNQQQGFQSIINHLNAQETTALRAELQSAQFQISQIEQTKNIINNLRNGNCNTGCNPCNPCNSCYPPLV